MVICRHVVGEREREREREIEREGGREPEKEIDRGKIIKDIIISKVHDVRLFGWLVGFLTSSSTTRLYRGRAPRQSV